MTQTNMAEKAVQNHNRIEQELIRVNRGLETLAACQKVLVRARDSGELLQDVCRVVVSTGGYRMAWVGIRKNNKARTIQPVATAGYTDGFFEAYKPSWAKDGNGMCPEGMAILSGQPFIVQDLVNHPDILAWRGEAIKRGYTSVISLPLRDTTGTIGALTLYTDRVVEFTPKELDLLRELSENLVYGISSLQARTERHKAQTEVKTSLEKLRKALGAIIQVLEQTVEIRDPYTAGHQRRVADLARMMGEELNLSSDRIDAIRISGIIHDIGKIYIPAEILSKPRQLTSLEFNLVKTHAQVGYDIMKTIDFPWPVAEIILQHHERIDGSGYPRQLKDGKILLEAKIIGIADVVEAMASHRPYRPALGLDAALHEIRKNRGKLYDPDAVDACLRICTRKDFSFKSSSFQF